MKAGRAALVGAAAAYPFLEPFLHRLRIVDVPVGPARPTVTILHLSDTHSGPRDRRLRRFLGALPEALGEAPDLVVVTGDLTNEDAGIDPTVDLLARLEARVGRFYVLGSHDYLRPLGPGYVKYLTGDREPGRVAPADVARLEDGLQEKGWLPLTNRTEIVESPRGRIRISGVDDPYIGRHRTDHIERRTEDDLAIGVTHAPDVVSEWILNGYDLVLAGHTHAGQVRVPGLGALVTNCSLPNGLAGGLHRVGNAHLHVSPGLGTGKYSPIRFACRPEATLLRLVRGPL